MRLLVLLEYLGTGGTEWQTVGMLPRLYDLGIEPELAVLFEHPDSSTAGELAARLERTSVPVHRFRLPRRWDLRSLRRITTELCRDRNIDIIHGKQYFAALSVAMTKLRLPRLRRVVSFHNLAYDHPDPSWRTEARRLSERALLRWGVDAFAAVSHGAAESYARHLGISPITVIPNAIDLADVDSSIASSSKATIRQAYGLGREDLMVLVPARQEKVKGHRFFVRAMRRVVDDGLPVRAVLAGRGPLSHQTRREVAELGLDEHFVFTDVDVERSELLRLMHTADLVVLPSTHEGFPNAAAEALATTTALIASRISGLVDLVEPERSGVLVPPADPAALADAMIGLLRDPARRTRLATEGRRRIEEGFSMEQVAASWRRFYDSVGR